MSVGSRRRGVVLGTLVCTFLLGLGPLMMAGEPEKPTGPSLGTPPTADTAAKDDKDAKESKDNDDKTPSVDGAVKTDGKSTERPAKTDDADKTSQPTKVDETTKTEQPPKAAPAKTESRLWGEPLASGIMELLPQEIMAGFRRRGNEDTFARFARYAGMKLSTSTAAYTGSELAGNCRLRWYDHLLRNPLKAPIEAEAFTRQLHKAVLNSSPQGLYEVLSIAAEKLDLPRRSPKTYPEIKSPEQALETVKQGLVDAQICYAAAIAPLSKGEINEMSQYLYPSLCGQNNVGHTLQDRGTGRRMTDLMERMDRDSLHAAAEALVPVTDPKLLEQLKGLSLDGDVSVPGVTGRVVARIDTPAGDIIVGGKGPNTYQLDDMGDVAAVIDLGGDDTYIDGTVSTRRPVLLLIDLAGNDTYRSVKPGVQGSGIFGVSILLDLEGNDTYQARDVAQGSALAGVGILIDYAGDDSYLAFRRGQATVVGGLGILIDRSGSDRYKGALWAQGHGGPLGFALLDDLAGDDHYYCGGMFPNSYLTGENPTPGYEGSGQGVGSGIRQVACGGIGVLLEGGGDDIYEYDYLCQGGGYWCGVGFARDFGGNDQRMITRKAYNGGERTQRSFGRFDCGWGCHYALGFCFDDAGNDTYEGSIMGLGMGWDCSVGVLVDFAGNDHYAATGSTTQGTGNQASLGILFDYDGDDVYDGYGQGYAPSGISYHDLPGCGGNFSFVIDYGGEDKYGCGAGNNTYNQRGSAGGFLIDRPKADELEKTVEKTEKTPTRTKAADKTAKKPSPKVTAGR